MAKLFHLDSDEPTPAWVHRIAQRAMAASKACGADLATQSAKAIEAVHAVHPYLSAQEVLATVDSEVWS